MKLDKRSLGMIAGLVVLAVVELIPIGGLSSAGKNCLALTLCTVVWWATQVAQPAYVGGLYLVSLVLLKVADVTVVFKPWTGTLMWLVIGAYLIAGAVRSSGLGERIAYAFIIRFVRSWRGLVVSIFVLTIILSLLIPHPWPRAFLILAVMLVVADSADLSKADRAKVGFIVFAASAPCSMFFLTGDASINPLAAAQSGQDVGFLSWFRDMSVPMLVAAGATMGLCLLLFKPEKQLSIDLDMVRAKQRALGGMTTLEKRTAFWLVVAIVLWATDSLHHIDIGWVTFGVALLMSLPLIGDVLTPASWSGVPVNVLIFLTSAMAIGTVGGKTGMNAWIASSVLPSHVPSNIFVLALLIGLITVVVHMVMGSVIAVMGICIPAFITFTSGSSISPVAIAMMVYTAINIHYILPFHNLAVLVGVGEENAGYSSKETMRLGIPLTGVVFVTLLVEAAWFHLLGMM